MPLMLNARSVPGTLDLHPVGFLHACLQRRHRARHLRVVHGADLEIEILERLGAHAGALGHARGGPAQHDPLGLADTVVQDRAQRARVKREHVGLHIGGLIDVGAPAQGDVSLHLFHAEQLQRRA